MTIDKFNKKYETFLHMSHYGLNTDNPKIILRLNNMLKDISTLSNFEYSQINAEYHTICLYSDLNGSRKVLEINLKDLFK